MRAVFPAPAIYRAQRLRSQLVSRKARAVFERAAREPGWLDDGMIEPYQRRYPLPPRHLYDPETLAKRGEERARRLIRALPNGKAASFLELGCWDGMVSLSLRHVGKAVTGIDIRRQGFDARVRAGEVRLAQMDAARLGFEDGAFDVVFSFDGFEHFPNPEATFAEAVRVTKPGGYIYLEFGPVYPSPMGAHLYRQISIPYCQHLFTQDSLQRFAGAKALGALDFTRVNPYGIEDFRRLWRRHADRLRRVKYYEIPDTAHVDLVVRHPTCFKSKTESFDNLIVSRVEALFLRLAEPGRA
jgi:SAM-dependent methyltransferase